MSNQLGAAYEARALQYLRRQRLTLVTCNYRCRRGEIDLIMRDPDGVLVFVEVRARRQRDFGGALESVTTRKRQRLVAAAEHYVATQTMEWPACRFDVIAFDGPPDTAPQWVRNAFDGSG